MPLALLIQEDASDAAPIREVCRRRGWELVQASSAAAGAAATGSTRVDALFACFRTLGGQWPEFPSISFVLAAPDEVRPALAAMQKGAFDYILRPATVDEVELKVARAVDSARWLEKKIEKILGGVRNGKGSVHPIIMSEVERVLILKVLEKTNGNQVQASSMLGINRNTLHKKIREYHLR
ncbi:MAG: hypothetical protein HYT87_16305 [Nitrospirae bacterium]|nr:hypothetical protein [Nitrospirota bacterium]